MNARPFQTATVRWLVAVGGLSLVGGLVLAAVGPDLARPDSSGSDSYSVSALGHQAFVSTLRALDIPVLSSRHASAERAEGSGVLVVAEPLDCPPGSSRAALLWEMVDRAPRALLVLPKWTAERMRLRHDWVERLSLRSEMEVEGPLEVLIGATSVLRVPAAEVGAWQVAPGMPQPTLPNPVVQLLPPGSVDPLVWSPAGVLLGEVSGRLGRLLVLSDPDVLVNAGIGQGLNAALLVSAVEDLRPDGGSVVIDETIHGHERTPSPWGELFRFPLVVFVVHGALLLALLLWAGTRRFGSPAAPDPVLEAGRGPLIANTADLLRYRGEVRTTVRDYLQTNVRDVRSALRVPPHLRGEELTALLDRVAAARGAEDQLSDLRAGLAAPDDDGRGGATRLLATASRIHRWRREILHGP